MNGQEGSKKFYHISAVAQMYGIHPQTLRLYEREGLLKPSRSDGNTRLYSEDDLKQLEFILNLTRDLGVNLAGVEVIINMKHKMDQIESEVNEFLEYVRREFFEGQEDEFEQRRQSLIRITPGKIVKIERTENKKDDK
jgi:MerR family transcriptional regulator/heat shock protein HspR